MKLFDCFMYNNEDLLLELRLNSLKKFVNKFVIVESQYDHQGNKKNLNFKIEKFNNFKDKIEYIILNEFPKNLSNWERENYHRNFINNGLNTDNDSEYGGVIYSQNYNNIISNSNSIIIRLFKTGE